MATLKACSRCGREFLARSNHGMYCSWRCKVGESTCGTCGRVFLPNALAGAHKYCSRRCAHQGYPKALHPKECPQCKESFQPTNAVQQFCGVDCAKMAQRVPRPHQTCAKCGEVLVNKPRNVRYCSRTCWRDAGGAWSERADKAERAAPLGAERVYARGYIWVKAAPGDWRQKHRVVMEQTLRRALNKYEQVHHINGRKDDNRPENLELWSGRHQPIGTRVIDAPHCPTCTCSTRL
jgi:hypothetical protein